MIRSQWLQKETLQVCTLSFTFVLVHQHSLDSFQTSLLSFNSGLFPLDGRLIGNRDLYHHVDMVWECIFLPPTIANKKVFLFTTCITIGYYQISSHLDIHKRSLSGCHTTSFSSPRALLQNYSFSSPLPARVLLFFLFVFLLFVFLPYQHGSSTYHILATQHVS